MSRRVVALTCGLLILVAPAAAAQESAQPAAPEPGSLEPPPHEPRSLDDLLERVKRGWNEERAENERRVARFRSAHDEQKRLLQEARDALASEEARGQGLEGEFEANETELARMEEKLGERLGTLGELFGVVRQVAGETRGDVEASLVSAQLPGREPFLEKLGKSKALPSIDALRQLWFTLLQEMTELGKVVRFPATVVTLDGDEVEREVVRVGPFNALADGIYLVWERQTQKLRELPRQPPGSYLATVARFERATTGMAGLALDPSSGGILSKLVQTPNLRERIDQGGIVGLVILCLGLVGGIVAIVRFAIVSVVGRAVAAQRKKASASTGNPLGRILAVYEDNRDQDVETLELKLDEVILRESARLDRLLWLVRVVGVVAPLLGLLGTVTGMIRTFQLITLYGAGDPKLMASGISEALVTTMLGLCVAIPMVLLHALVQSSTKRTVEILEEQAAGMIARQAELQNAVA